MVDLNVFLLTLIWGIAIGCIYVLLATGLNLVFGVMKLVNFAHGELLVIGAYTCYSITSRFGLNPYLSVFISMILIVPVGIAVERLCFRRVLRTNNKLNEIFVSLGLIYVFDNIVVLLWGDKAKRIISPFEYFSISFGGLSIGYDWLIAILIVVFILCGLWVLITKTKMGMAMRATSQDGEAATLMGINIDKIYMFSFGLGSALAAASGALYGIMFPFNPYVGALPTIKAFAIIMLGGLGSVPGAVIGGLLYGIAEQTAIIALGGIWRDAIAFIMLAIVLIIRPTGLFGERNE